VKQTVRELKGDRIRAVDGVIGFIKDVHFDEQRWKVRYLEVDLGELLPGRRALIDTQHMAPDAMRDPNGTSVRVQLTCEEVRNAPQPGCDRARSAVAASGYTVQAPDGTLGAVHDFVVEDAGWAISEVVVDTRPWWPGGHVGLQPHSVERIDSASRTMYLRLARDGLGGRPHSQ
jgi:uncharacterized protein YrrD